MNAVAYSRTGRPTGQQADNPAERCRSGTWGPSCGTLGPVGQNYFVGVAVGAGVAFAVGAGRDVSTLANWVGVA